MYFFGGRPVGLLVKSLHGVAARRAAQLGAAADVAVAGVRPRGHDAEQHELAGCRHAGGALQAVGERGGILHDVIGRHHGDDRLGRVLHGGKGGDGHRCRGVAGHRLEDDRLGLDGGAGELLAHEETVVVVTDDDRRRKAGIVDAAQRGREQTALAVEEADELLGVHRARQRPQAGAGAAGENHWSNGGHRRMLSLWQPNFAHVSKMCLAIKKRQSRFRGR